MVIIFDLDDTCYEEASFVRGGLEAAACHLATYIPMSKEKILDELYVLFRTSRANIFDRFLHAHSLFTKKRVAACITLYRYHTPHIVPYPEAIRALERFKHYPLYLVTDGHKIVQHRKVMALGIASYFRHIFYTSRYGIQHAKPSSYCFKKIAHLEKVGMHSLVYIGDNPNKDFVGIKPHGVHTIRVLTGQHKDLVKDRTHEAECTIKTLDELTEELLRWQMK